MPFTLKAWDLAEEQFCPPIHKTPWAPPGEQKTMHRVPEQEGSYGDQGDCEPREELSDKNI